MEYDEKEIPSLFDESSNPIAFNQFYSQLYESDLGLLVSTYCQVQLVWRQNTPALPRATERKKC